MPLRALHAVCVYLGLVGSVHAATWSLPIERRSLTRADRTLKYTSFTSLLAHGSSRSHASVWELGGFNTHHRDFEPQDELDVRPSYLETLEIYVMTAYLGTPPQPVTLELDVTEADFWVINHKIDGKVGTQAFYNHNKSSSYRANGTVVIDVAAATGYESSDRVIIGDLQGNHRVADGHNFVELAGDDRFLKHLICDGLLGLGAGGSWAGGAPSFVRTMIEQGHLDEPIVSLDLSGADALVTFGGINKSRITGAVTFFPSGSSNGKSSWRVPVTGVFANGRSFSSDGAQAAMTITPPFFSGPSDQVYALADAVGAENFALPCETPGPDITIEIGGQFQVTLTKRDYAQPTEYEGVCMFAFIPTDLAPNTWSFGPMKNLYMVLDFGHDEREERVGLAHLAKHP